MLALFTKSWRRKAAVLTLVLYGLGISAPAVAFVMTEVGAHCITVSEAKQDADYHHGHDAEMASDHASHPAPAADDHGMTGKCCGTFCVTALPPTTFPIAEPQTQVSATPQPLVVQLLGQGSVPLDRPPRNLLSI